MTRPSGMIWCGRGIFAGFIKKSRDEITRYLSPYYYYKGHNHRKEIFQSCTFYAIPEIATIADAQIPFDVLTATCGGAGLLQIGSSRSQHSQTFCSPWASHNDHVYTGDSSPSNQVDSSERGDAIFYLKLLQFRNCNNVDYCSTFCEAWCASWRLRRGCRRTAPRAPRCSQGRVSQLKNSTRRWPVVSASNDYHVCLKRPNRHGCARREPGTPVHATLFA